MKRKLSKLELRFLFGFVLLSVLVCGSNSVIGYYQYRDSIQDQYNEQAYNAAEVALSYVDLDDLRRYVKLAEGYRDGTVSRSEIAAVRMATAYQRVDEQMLELQVAMGASDIMIFALDVDELMSYNGTREGWEPLLYIFDNYHTPDLAYVSCARWKFNQAFIQELHENKATGQLSDNQCISKGEYGYNPSAMLPGIDEDGSVLAIVTVETPMATLEARLRQYLLSSILTTAALTVVFISLYMVYLYRHVIRPVNLITQETDRFVRDRAQIGTELSMIRTNDEIQNLAASIQKMQVDLNLYIDNLTRITAEKERIGAELNVAAKIQSDMLPCIFPAFPDYPEFDIYATMTPAKDVGGDFYDFFLGDNDHLALVMADVSGKGVPAALFMMISKTCWL